MGFKLREVPKGFVAFVEGDWFAVAKAQFSECLLPLMRLSPPELAGKQGVRLTSGKGGPCHLAVPGMDSPVFVGPLAGRGLFGLKPEAAFRQLEIAARGFSAGLSVPEVLGLTCRRVSLVRWEAEIWSWWMAGAMSFSLCLKQISMGSDAKKDLLLAVARALRSGHDGGLGSAGNSARGILVTRSLGSWKALLVGPFLDLPEPRLSWEERSSQLRELFKSLALEQVFPGLMNESDMAFLVRSYLNKEQVMFEGLMGACKKAVGLK